MQTLNAGTAISTAVPVDAWRTWQTAGCYFAFCKQLFPADFPFTGYAFA